MACQVLNNRLQDCLLVVEMDDFERIPSDDLAGRVAQRGRFRHCRTRVKNGSVGREKGGHVVGAFDYVSVERLLRTKLARGAGAVPGAVSHRHGAHRQVVMAAILLQWTIVHAIVVFLTVFLHGSEAERRREP